MITPILLVEDDENDVFFFERAMSKAGVTHPLHVARDGQQAIDYLQGASRPQASPEFSLPGLILLDLKLPFVMGLDVLKWIRTQPALARLVVVILSSSVDPADVSSAYALGANAYLVKPAEAVKLSEIVRAINDFWLVQNRSPILRLGRGVLEPPAHRSREGHRMPATTEIFACSRPSELARRDI